MFIFKLATLSWLFVVHVLAYQYVTQWYADTVQGPVDTVVNIWRLTKQDE